MSGPKAVDSTTAACCSAVSPERLQQVDEAIVLSFGGDRLELGGEAVDAAVELVLGLDRLVAERSAPLCWRTPYSTVLAVTSSASGVEWLSSGWSRATYAMLESRPRVMDT